MAHHDHSMHNMDMGHGGGMDKPHMCSMNMLFTWSTDNLCIVFRSWHVTNTFNLILSLLAIVALCAGYEAVREISRRYEASETAKIANIPTTPKSGGTILAEVCSQAAPGEDGGDEDESSSLLWVGSRRQSAEKTSEIVKAALYAVQVFYSFFIMLLFMTYNGWVMIAVAVGAFLGHLVWGKTSATKSVACH